MNPRRRAWLHRLAALPLLAGGAPAGAAPDDDSDRGIRRGRPLIFPRDHGAHTGTRTEWWYVTGWLSPDGQPVPTHGFQVTFFRSRTQAAGGAASAPGRFAPNHVLFAHAALTDLGARRHLHAQRIARWNGDPRPAPAGNPDRAALADADVRLARWHLARDPASDPAASRWTSTVHAEGFALQAQMTADAPPLRQGDAGFSRKGPDERQASHYYSLPQMRTRLDLELDGRRVALRGRAWLDHEWSDELLHPEAVGWDWIGIHLLDGGALTAFRLRRADGSTLWAGGSLRRAAAGPAAEAVRAFTPQEVQFTPGRTWRSPATHAAWPVQWTVQTPAGRHTVRALLDAQELDGRAGTGTVYWEGLSELLDEGGRRVGLGYLEMTGYAAPIRLG